jgi:hypothetical protein
MRILILVLFWSGTFVTFATAAGKAPAVPVARFESAPAIDGHLDEEIWKQATPLRNFYRDRLRLAPQAGRPRYFVYTTLR